MEKNILQPLVQGWAGKIRLAQDHKRLRFGEDATEGMRFFCGPYNFMYDQKYAKSSAGFRFDAGESEAGFPNPCFKMSVNRVAEMVQLFGPVLYHKNPIRQVNPRKFPEPPIGLLGDPNDPTPIGPPQGPGMPPPTMGQMVQQRYQQMQQQIGQERAVDQARAQLLETYLNYTPNELNLKDHMRAAIDECIIKGMGTTWQELYVTKSGQRLVGSFWDSVDHLQIDPDMESIKDAKWIARYCVHPVWEVEREYGLKEGSLKGNLESANQQAETNADADGDYDRKRGLTNDLLGYWKIWSKMGAGGRLSGIGKDMRALLEPFGDYIYLVIADHIPYPLNLPTDVPMSQEDFQQRLQWPIPFWKDDEWPFTPIIFHPIPRQVWPMSHLKPALGELKFLNWTYSFLAGKVRTTSRDFIAIRKGAAEEIKNTILNGTDLELLEIEASHGNTISEVVQFLQHPSMQGDIFKVLELIEHNFEKRTGLSELMYGMSARQMRSAQEATIKSDQLAIRPDDMSNRVEEAATSQARKEAIAARWYLTPQDVAPILGPTGTQLWQQLVYTQEVSAVSELEYRLEAGSAKKPNKDRDAANMSQAMQIIAPNLFEYAMSTGDVGPYNAMITDWSKSVDMVADDYLLKPPPPPPQPPDEGAIAEGEHQADMQGKQQDMAHKEDQHQQDQRHAQEKHKLALKHAKEKAKQKPK